MPIIHVNIATGRSQAMKETMACKITEAVAEALAADTSSIRVLIHEIPSEDWFAGGISLTERARKKGGEKS